MNKPTVWDSVSSPKVSKNSSFCDVEGWAGKLSSEQIAHRTCILAFPTVVSSMSLVDSGVAVPVDKFSLRRLLSRDEDSPSAGVKERLTLSDRFDFDVGEVSDQNVIFNINEKSRHIIKTHSSSGLQLAQYLVKILILM